MTPSSLWQLLSYLSYSSIYQQGALRVCRHNRNTCTYSSIGRIPRLEGCIKLASFTKRSMQFRRICSRSPKRFFDFSATFSFSSLRNWID
ncbi:hypothetical protein L1987_11946 [Smallanthus sonchifolius]|uniref:Uncharacterized protein n=1 Tax=Smallanthus sonchifolius TaxID=185202 RepID=A0ACB9JDX8_9ASTR|nr:hypothetical protein L1987_11946 [Smallanthus sonchifolius]